MSGILTSFIGRVAGVVTDAYYNLVTLLLPGNGTNGAQNNTFLDSSTNNFTITRNGNTTQGTFSPFSQTGWGNFFPNAANDSIGVTSTNAAFALGTGDFTIEGWFNPTAPTYAQGFFHINTAVNSTVNGYGVGITSAGLIQYYGGTTFTNTNVTVTSGLWYHIALVRSSGTLRIYVNGVSPSTGGSISDSQNLGNSVCYIGLFYATTGFCMTGHVSNFRVTKGGALYTSSFTPSTTPLTTTVSSGTVSFLTSQSNRFVDNSASPLTLTIAGSPSVQAFSPFAPTAAYSADTVGGSGYFDGSGDFMTVANNAAFNFGSGEFCVETWAYILPAATSEGLVCMANIGTGAGSWMLWLNASNQIAFYVTTGGSTATRTDLAQSSVRPENCWTHIVVCRSGTTLSLFVNGSRAATATYSSTIFNNTTDALTIGAAVGGGNDIPAYLSGTRIIKGSSPYDATLTTLTVPTAPATNITNTSILLNYTNAGITDATAKNDLETVGNAQISTTQSKFGGSSMYFDGNGDNLSSPTSPNLDMGTGNFTVEAWVYVSSRTLNYPLIVGNNNGSYSAGAIALTNSNNDSASYFDKFVLAVYDIATPTLVASSTNSLNTWYHLAIVRNGTTLTMYRDGVSVASTTISSAAVFNWGKSGLRVGGGNWDAAQSYFNGYIDDLRITKGYARYTANFTAPTASFPLQ